MSRIVSVLALAAVLIVAPQALATTRYAVPGGNASDPSCLSKAANCSIQHADDVSSNGDELVISSGTYDFGASAGPTIAHALNIHGEDGQPRPLLTNSGNQVIFFDVGGDGTSIRYLEFDAKGDGAGLVVGGGSSSDVTIDNVVAIARGSGANEAAIGGFIGGRVSIGDTTAYAPHDNGVAILSPSTLYLDNVTAVAPGNGGVALSQGCQQVFFSSNPCSTNDGFAHSLNSIFDGGPGGADIKTTSGSCGTSCIATGNFQGSFTNYDDISDCCGSTTIEPPGSPTNQTAPPQLVNEAGGDFHELVSSPTRDAGSVNPANGPIDPDGNPRQLGPAPDIGAFEYNGTPIPVTLPATNIGQTTATLNGTVDPRGFDTAYFFQWGTTTGYGNQFPPSAVNTGASVGPMNVAANAAGFPPNTLIHYRLVASNTYGGETFGGDQTFVTSSPGAGAGALFKGLRLKVHSFRLRGRFVVVPIPCPSTGACTGNISFRTAAAVLAKKKHKRKLALGKAKFSIAAGKTGKVRVKLSKSAVKLVKRAHSLRTVVTINATENGQTKKTTQKVTLKPAKKKRR